MKKQLILIISILLLTEAGCNQSGKNIVIGEEYDNPVIINPEPDKSFSSELHDYIDTVKYVFLETAPVATIGTINKIIYKNNRYYLGDFDNTLAVYCFSDKGDYLFRIQKQGKGPGEYINLNDFDVEEESGNIFIHDDLRRSLLIYDNNGEFEKKYDTGLIFSSFNLTGNKTVLLYAENVPNLSMGNNQSFNIIIWNYATKNALKTFLPIREELELFLKTEGLLNYSSYGQDAVYCYDLYSNAIYSYKANRFEKKYLIDFGSKAIPAGFWANAGFDSYREKISEGSFCSGLINYQVAGSYIIGCYTWKQASHIFIYDMERSVTLNTKPSVLRTKAGFLLFFLPPFHTDGKNIISVMEPVWILRDIKAVGKELNIPPEFYNLSHHSNPVLQIIKLK